MDLRRGNSFMAADFELKESDASPMRAGGFDLHGSEAHRHTNTR